MALPPGSANHKALRVLVLAAIRLVDLSAEEEETSPPHARLSCNHLRVSFSPPSRFRLRDRAQHKRITLTSKAEV
jgi:hypothetical protein